jgi:hypothetical protein
MMINKGAPVYTAEGDDSAYDITGEEFMANFPNMTSSDPPFIAKYIEADSYNDFFDAVYEFRNEPPVYPYKFGSL